MTSATHRQLRFAEAETVKFVETMYGLRLDATERERRAFLQAQQRAKLRREAEEAAGHKPRKAGENKKGKLKCHDAAQAQAEGVALAEQVANGSSLDSDDEEWDTTALPSESDEDGE